MKTVIIGYGRIGKYLSKRMVEAGYDTIVISRHQPNDIEHSRAVEADIHDAKAVYHAIRNHNGEIVINTAAYTSVDGCERDPLKSMRTNAIGALNVANACIKTETCKILIHLSTDYVFDGRKGDYRETDVAIPINTYGRSKLLGERLVRSALARSDRSLKYYILRISTPYYYPSLGRDTLMSMIVENLKEGKTVKLATDLYSTPTSAEELYRAIERIIEKLYDAPSGIYHFGGYDKVSRYEFGIYVAKIFHLPGEKIIPVRAEQLGLIAQRPRDSSLNSSRFMRIFNFRMRPLKEWLLFYRG